MLALGHIIQMPELPTRLIDYHHAMEAVDQTRNIARAYRIEASPDLFGHVIVALHWGRIGRRGSSLRVSFASEEAARRFVQRTLARRASAPRRIGVAYHPVGPRSIGSAHDQSQVANEGL
jgi:predicted DNA-binding WGR domain protein